MRFHGRFTIASCIVLTQLTATSSSSHAAPPVGAFTTGEGGIAGAGYRLVIDRQLRYRLHISTCTGEYLAESGRVREPGDGEIETTPNAKANDRATPTRYAVIKWGPRLYAVNDFVRFVNEVNQGAEPRTEAWGHTLMRSGDWSKAVTGSPALPAPWNGRVLAKPLMGTVTSVTPQEKDGTPMPTTIGIDRGETSGAFVGMELFVTTDDGMVLATVSAVEGAQCIAETSVSKSIKIGQTARSDRPTLGVSKQ